jgi:hypothetical protein
MDLNFLYDERDSMSHFEWNNIYKPMRKNEIELLYRQKLARLEHCRNFVGQDVLHFSVSSDETKIEKVWIESVNGDVWYLDLENDTEGTKKIFLDFYLCQEELKSLPTELIQLEEMLGFLE